ncbi:MAG: LTA synthase family protein [Flavobacteriales bacterium]|nr:LTA synthase family protein [Flavobacteriales bacterium]
MKKVLFGLQLIFVTIYFLVTSSELVTYAEWEGKLSAKVLIHLQHPSEIVAVASPKYILLFFGTLIPLVVFATILYKKTIHDRWKLESTKIKWFITLPLKLIIAGFLVVIIRGGFAKFPIELSSAYYSSNQFLNDVSTNTLWSFLYSVNDGSAGLKGNPYTYLSEPDAKNLVLDLYQIEKDTTIFVINTPRPNIVLIILESWSADVIEALGGYKGITPNFDHLRKEGLLFTHFYSNGWTSDQAMASIYSSAVVFPNYNVVNNPKAFTPLPAFTDQLHTAGYNTSCFYGGQLIHGNIKGFLLNKGIQQIKEGADFPYSFYKTGSMGIHDGDMLNLFIEETNQLEPPFFTNWFTLSSHSPYDFPGSHTIDWGEKHEDYLNSIAYSDSCLGAYFSIAKQQDWYKNTLFMLVADHGHVSPINWEHGESGKSHIPFLLFGDGLKNEYKNRVNEKIGGNLDIASTLLHQLNLDASSFIYSKNLLNPYTNDFAPFAFHGGIGWKTNAGEYSYSTRLKEDVRITDPTKGTKEMARAYYQIAFDYFYKP